MSRSSKRLESFREAPKRKRERIAPPQPWTRKEKLAVWGSLLCLMLFVVVMPFVAVSASHQRKVEKRVTHWRHKYELTEDQASKILRIEMEYHKSDSPVSISPPRSQAEKDAHAREIAALMGEAAGKRFLEDEASSKNGH